LEKQDEGFWGAGNGFVFGMVGLGLSKTLFWHLGGCGFVLCCFFQGAMLGFT
jgi:hypothetical protein